MSNCLYIILCMSLYFSMYVYLFFYVFITIFYIQVFIYFSMYVYIFFFVCLYIFLCSISIYLSIQDGLELWLTILHNTAKPSPVLVNLLPRLPSLLENGTENLRTIVYIIQVRTIFAISFYQFTYLLLKLPDIRKNDNITDLNIPYCSALI